MFKDKHLFYICLSAILLWGQAIIAQEPKDLSPEQLITDLYNKLQTEHKELENQNKQLQKDLSEKTKEIERLNQKIESLSKEVDKLKKREGVDILNQKVAALQSGTEALIAENNNYKTHIENQKGQIEVLNATIDSLNEEYAPLVAFKKEFLTNKFSKEYSEYLKLPFSKMDPKKLKMMRSEFEPYDKDKEVKGILNSIDKAINHCDLVATMTQLLHEKFNIPNIVNARNIFERKIDPYKKNFTPGQFLEMDSLDISLARYIEAVQAFQSMISINNKKKSAEYNIETDSEQLNMDCAKKMEPTFERYSDDIKDRINRIPYLRLQFEKYRAWVTTTPLKKNAEVEAIITEVMNLKTR